MEAAAVRSREEENGVAMMVALRRRFAQIQWLNVVAGRRQTRALMEEDGGGTVAALLQLRGGANGCEKKMVAGEVGA